MPCFSFEADSGGFQNFMQGSRCNFLRTMPANHKFTSGYGAFHEVVAGTFVDKITAVFLQQPNKFCCGHCFTSIILYTILHNNTTAKINLIHFITFHFSLIIVLPHLIPWLIQITEHPQKHRKQQKNQASLHIPEDICIQKETQ